MVRKKRFLSILNQRKRIFYAGSLDIIKKYPVVGVLASGKAPGSVVWDTYRFFYSIRDEKVTFAGGWHSPHFTIIPQVLPTFGPSSISIPFSII